jgi:hypothetical protein
MTSIFSFHVYSSPHYQKIQDILMQTKPVTTLVNFHLDVQHSLSIYTYIYRVSQEEGTKLREGVPYVKVYRYNPKHLYPKLNGFGDNGQ